MMTRYDHYRAMLGDSVYPLGYVDLDLYDQNVRELVDRAKGRPIRLATKSIRCLELIRRTLANPGFQGVMAYRGYEAVKLADAGIHDILMGYPLADPKEIAACIEKNSERTRIILMVDRPEHLDQIELLSSRSATPVPICIDLDVSTEFSGTYYGVHRSWITSDERLTTFLEHLVKKCPNLRLVAAMGYEAQVAGIPDVTPEFRAMKKTAIPELNSRRARWVAQIEAKVGKLRFVNGGGTGSFEGTLLDSSVTELTSGSGLFSPGLFDHYENFKHHPAAGYVLQVVRKPADDQATCFSGGYIASGGVGALKAPIPMDPPGLSLFDREGAGEVQTPVFGESARKLKIGDLVFFRHAKAGEMNERFSELTLFSKAQPPRRVPTYRGENWNFG